MDSHKTAAVVLVAATGLGLHLAFRGLAGELPQIFPHLSREVKEEIVLPVVMETMEETAAPRAEAVETAAKPEPPAAVPIKRSGEEPRLSRRLVSLTPIPKHPPIKTGKSGKPEGVSASFEIPPKIAFIVDFWRKIYATYSTHQVLIHDMEFLDIQYGVLDFTEVDERPLSDREKKAIREAEVQKELMRIRDILTELHETGPLSEESKRIASLLRPLNDPDKFEKAKERVRSQVGLKDRFREGLRRSGKYMTLFEEIFQSYGVPKEITRLVFVESLFKERALSKVGAAGLWQFMGDTARRYMVVDRLVDERYDPVVATHGAARLLLRNYELLGTWPLAINAYNSGPGNLLRAISRLGTKEIATIITNYKGGSYAFASRNFYPSFLAALSIYENQENHFGSVEKEPPLEFDLLELPATMSFPEIAYLADRSVEDLKELNPAFAPVVFEGNYSIPAGSQIRLPDGSQQLFAARFVDFFSGIEPPLLHVVASGESLEKIASRYEISSHELQKANTLHSKVQRGRVLLIPNRTSLVRNKLSF